MTRFLSKFDLVFFLFSVVSVSWLASSARGDCPQGLVAFTHYLHSPILRKACTACHDSGGIGPAHSVADAATSYAQIRGYVNFAQADNSKLLQYVRSRHWVSYDPQAQGVSEAEFRQALDNWWNFGEKDCSNPTTPQSLAIQIPDNLSESQFARMDWSMDSMGGVFVGSRFEVEIKRLVAPSTSGQGAYLVRNPRLATPLPGVALEGVEFYINGKPQEYANSWKELGVELSGHMPSGAGVQYFRFAPALSARSMVLLQDAPNGDRLSFSLRGARSIATPQCRALSVFQSEVFPLMKRSQCISCHASSRGLNDTQRMSLTGSGAEICGVARERIHFARPDSSPLLLFGFAEALGHPPVGDAEDFVRPFERWVDAESVSTLKEHQ